MISFVRTLALNLKISVELLWIFKVRTALALLGVMLGALSTIIVTSLSLSLQKQTQESLSSLGENLLIVRSGFTHSLRAERLMANTMTLTLDDVKAVKNSSNLIKTTVPAVNKVYPVRFKDITLSDAFIVGTSEEYFDLRGYELEKGSFFSQGKDYEKVAVIGNTVAEELFSFYEPLGKYIYIDRLPCKVIGVLKPQGLDLSGTDQDKIIAIPLKTFLKRLTNSLYINQIYIQAEHRDFLSMLKQEIEGLLNMRHGIKKGQRGDFSVVDMRDVVALQENALKTVKTLGLISASVSFTISTLGILSIMVLMVSERKIEIGLRRAVGAKKRDLLFQFLLESSFIALMGSLTGVIVGPLVNFFILKVVSLPFALSLKGIVISLCASVCIGIISGTYPGLKAAKINPVDILQG